MWAPTSWSEGGAGRCGRMCGWRVGSWLSLGSPPSDGAQGGRGCVGVLFYWANTSQCLQRNPRSRPTRVARGARSGVTVQGPEYACAWVGFHVRYRRHARPTRGARGLSSQATQSALSTEDSTRRQVVCAAGVHGQALKVVAALFRTCGRRRFPHGRLPHGDTRVPRGTRAARVGRACAGMAGCARPAWDARVLAGRPPRTRC